MARNGKPKNRKKLALHFDKSLQIPQGLVRLTCWHTNKPLYIDRSLIVFVKPLPAGHYEPESDCDCDACQEAISRGNGAVEAGERTLIVAQFGDTLVMETPDEVMGLIAEEIPAEGLVEEGLVTEDLPAI